MDSIQLSRKEISSLKKEIKNLKKIPTKNRHEILRAEGDGLLLILYKSGSLVYEGDASGILDRILEPESLSTIGTDEAGKGEWFGPLVTVSIALSPEEITSLRKLGVRDSKTLSRKKLPGLAKKLLKFPHQSLVLKPETYNKLYKKFKREGKTLNDLLAWSHSKAIKDLLAELEPGKKKIIIDRFDLKKTELRLRSLDKKNLEIIQKYKAEKEIPVAAASILAKYAFEKKVDELNRKFGIDLRKVKPEKIDKKILPLVAKLHFKNVPG